MKHKPQKTTGNKKITDGLNQLLADTYHLYLKTQNFHWNVQGPNFYTYHKMFEVQYNQLAEATDVIAERIRALNSSAPASFSEFLKLTTLKEVSKRPDATGMIKTLLADHEHMAHAISELCTVAQDYEDEVTLDLFIERKSEHDKTAWMLRSTLGQS